MPGYVGGGGSGSGGGGAPPSTTNPPPINDSGTVGTATTYAHGDHTHAGVASLNYKLGSVQITTSDGLLLGGTSSTVDLALYVADQTEGDLLTRGSAFWDRLAAGTTGQVLTANGVGQPLSWATLSTSTPATATPSDVASTGAVGTQTGVFALGDHAHKGVHSVSAFNNGEYPSALGPVYGNLSIGGKALVDPTDSTNVYGDNIVAQVQGSQLQLELHAAGQTRGDFLVADNAINGGSGTYWKRITPGASGTTLISNGPGIIPTWGTLSVPQPSTTSPSDVGPSDVLGTQTNNFALADHAHAGVSSVNSHTGAVNLASFAGPSGNSPIGLESSTSGSTTTFFLELPGTAGATIGDLYTYTSTGWARLPASTSGKILQTQGTTNPPQWVAPTAIGVYPADTTTPTVVAGTGATAGTGTSYARGDHAHILGFAGQATGDLLCFSGSAWGRLAAGTSGQYLQTSGTAGAAQWATVTSGAPATTTPSAIASAGAVGTITGNYALADHTHAGVASVNALTGAVSVTGSGAITTSTAGSTVSITLTGTTSTVGGIYGFTSTGYGMLAPGTAGYVLQSGGSGADIAWVNPATFTPQPSTTTPTSVGSTAAAIGSAATYAKADHAHAFSFPSEAQGDVLCRSATGWTRLAAGTAGGVLQTNGSGANPAWSTLDNPDPATNTPAPVAASGAKGTQSNFYALADHAHAGVASFNTVTGALTFSANGGITLSGGTSSNPSIALTGSGGAAIGALYGYGSSGYGFLAPGSSGSILQSNGSGSDLTWVAASGIGAQPSNNNPIGVGSATITSGVASTFSRSDHTHIITFTGETWGDIAVRGQTGWKRFAAGTFGQVLTTQGSGADPAWSTPSAPVASSTTPVAIASTGAVGTATTYARGDHTHAGVTSVNGQQGVVTVSSPTAASATPSSVGSTAAAVGVSAKYALEDHAHAFSFPSEAQGDVLYRSATGWTRLGAGTVGQYLATGGAAANPSWGTPTTSLGAGTDGQIYAANGGTNGFTSTPNLAGSINLVSAGGMTTSSRSAATGYAITITAGANTSSTQAGGSLNLNGGTSTGTGGAVFISAGTTSGTTTAGAGITFTASSGGSTSGAGGGFSFIGGANAGGSSNGGGFSVTAGTAASSGSGTGAGGNVSLTAGAAGSTGATAGTVTLTAGSGSGGAPGTVTINAGTQSGTGAGAGITLNASGGNTASAAGSLTLNAGANTAGGAGGNILLNAGNNTSTGVGGSMTFTSGGTTGSGAVAGGFSFIAGQNTNGTSTAASGSVTFTGFANGASKFTGAYTVTGFGTHGVTTQNAYFFQTGGFTGQSTPSGVIHVGQAATTPTASPTGTSPGVFLWVDSSQILTVRGSTSQLMYMTSAFGSAGTGLFVASTSGGSPTTQVFPRALTIAGAAFSVLATS